VIREFVHPKPRIVKIQMIVLFKITVNNQCVHKYLSKETGVKGWRMNVDLKVYV